MFSWRFSSGSSQAKPKKYRSQYIPHTDLCCLSLISITSPVYRFHFTGSQKGRPTLRTISLVFKVYNIGSQYSLSYLFLFYLELILQILYKFFNIRFVSKSLYEAVERIKIFLGTALLRSSCCGAHAQTEWRRNCTSTTLLLIYHWQLYTMTC